MAKRAREEEDSTTEEEHSQSSREEEDDEEEDEDEELEGEEEPTRRKRGGKKRRRMEEEEEEESKGRVPLLVTIKVVGQERAVRHTMRMTDKLQVLMDVWYHKVPETKDTGLFMFDGCQVSANSTPEDLEMEDGDMVDFFHHVTGGALVAGWVRA